MFHRLPGEFNQPHTTYHLLFYCRAANSIPQISPEVLEFGYFEMQSISNWHKDHALMAHKALEYHAKKR